MGTDTISARQQVVEEDFFPQFGGKYLEKLPGSWLCQFQTCLQTQVPEKYH